METKAVVLKSLRLGEGLRALSLYTELLGRVNAIVKVKRGEFPIKFEPFSVVQLKLLQKGERFEVQEAKLIKENFPRSSAELHYRSKVVKPLIKMELPGSKKLFRLIESYLSIEEDFEVAYPMFLSKLLFLEGLYPQLRRCVKCGSGAIAAFSVKRGGVVCPVCKEEGEIGWSREHSRELVKLTKEPFKKVRGEVRRELLPQITRALEGHLKERID
jgi:DNA repair protein RecO (recombination protein O)